MHATHMCILSETILRQTFIAYRILYNVYVYREHSIIITATLPQVWPTTLVCTAHTTHTQIYTSSELCFAYIHIHIYIYLHVASFGYKDFLSHTQTCAAQSSELMEFSKSCAAHHLMCDKPAASSSENFVYCLNIYLSSIYRHIYINIFLYNIYSRYIHYTVFRRQKWARMKTIDYNLQLKLFFFRWRGYDDATNQ